MALIRARVVAVGSRDSFSGVALVDTGSLLTLVDRTMAERLGVELIGRRVRLVVADGHELEGDMAVLRRLVVDDEELPYAHVVIAELGERLREAPNPGASGLVYTGARNTRDPTAGARHNQRVSEEDRGPAPLGHRPSGSCL